MKCGFERTMPRYGTERNSEEMKAVESGMVQRKFCRNRNNKFTHDRSNLVYLLVCRSHMGIYHYLMHVLATF